MAFGLYDAVFVMPRPSLVVMAGPVPAIAGSTGAATDGRDKARP
jgi:hypothetical protein